MAGSAFGELTLTLGSCRHDAELSAEAAARKLEALRVYGASQESAELLRVRCLTDNVLALTLTHTHSLETVRAVMHSQCWACQLHRDRNAHLYRQLMHAPALPCRCTR